MQALIPRPGAFRPPSTAARGGRTGRVVRPPGAGERVQAASDGQRAAPGHRRCHERECARMIQVRQTGSIGGTPSGGHDPLANPTPHERDVLLLIREGLTNRQIGERMLIAERTVKNYVSMMVRKLRYRAAHRRSRLRGPHVNGCEAGSGRTMTIIARHPPTERRLATPKADPPRCPGWLPLPPTAASCSVDPKSRPRERVICREAGRPGPKAPCLVVSAGQRSLNERIAVESCDRTDILPGTLRGGISSVRCDQNQDLGGCLRRG